jgi:hypothetical protein
MVHKVLHISPAAHLTCGRTVRLSFVLLIACNAVVSAQAGGPFGLHAGMTKQELSRIGKLEQPEGSLSYSLSTVPLPHRSFESYMVVITDKAGLCKISAIGKTVFSSVYGTELQSAFDDVEEALTKKYGSHERTDGLRSGSIWDEPKDWMMGLHQKERYLATYWFLDRGATLSDHIVAIALEAHALSGNKGWLELSYEFDNFKACKDELTSKSNDAL